MIRHVNYGDYELGVECALPARHAAPRPRGRARAFFEWLVAALSRRGR